jgi:hypothetical protein
MRVVWNSFIIFLTKWDSSLNEKYEINADKIFNHLFTKKKYFNHFIESMTKITTTPSGNKYIIEHLT